MLFQAGYEIAFAHTSFNWKNLAAHNAGVTVVIVGLGSSSSGRRRLFEVDDNGEAVVRDVDNINAYLIAGPNTNRHRRIFLIERTYGTRAERVVSVRSSCS